MKQNNIIYEISNRYWNIIYFYCSWKHFPQKMQALQNWFWRNDRVDIFMNNLDMYVKITLLFKWFVLLQIILTQFFELNKLWLSTKNQTILQSNISFSNNCLQIKHITIVSHFHHLTDFFWIFYYNFDTKIYDKCLNIFTNTFTFLLIYHFGTNDVLHSNKQMNCS